VVEPAGDLVVGVDVGGTYTDCLLLDPAGRFRVSKVPTTPSDQSRGFLAGLDALGFDASALRTLVHGTTVATNAVSGTFSNWRAGRGRTCMD
jgi:N-methylhydantoinase A